MRVLLHSGGPLGPEGRREILDFLGERRRVAFVTAASLHDESIDVRHDEAKGRDLALRALPVRPLPRARPRLQTFLKISLPQALPSIFAGLKVSVTLAVVGAREASAAAWIFIVSDCDCASFSLRAFCASASSSCCLIPFSLSGRM